ncbi:hypothetical protein L7F22_036495 [Adiantum nelumboides]|nr:hypothetical protein [Adiantum nelumboides]MCO5558332.1 hypothetical protein [Adiantum nelumboides]MCO5582597.1 hypothetical protein [Adiantum nelumboides]
MRPEQSGSILQCRYSKNNVKLNVLHVLNERLQAIELRIQTSELKEEESRHLPKKDDQGHSTKEGTSSSDKSETMSLQPTEQKNEKTDSPSLAGRKAAKGWPSPLRAMGSLVGAFPIGQFRRERDRRKGREQQLPVTAPSTTAQPTADPVALYEYPPKWVP